MSKYTYITGSGKIFNWNANTMPAEIQAEIDYLVEKEALKYGTGDWQESCLDVVAVLPGSPDPGDRYIFTGAGDYENNIAEYNGTAWVYIAPKLGMVSYVEAGPSLYTYNGTAWVAGSGDVPAHTHVEADVTDLDKYTQGETDTLLSAKLSLSGGTMTGNVACAGAETFDGRDLSVDGSKLDGVATGATANAFFVSAEQTGTGAEQTIAHGLGVVPSAVIASITDDNNAAFTIAYGAHDATNVYLTVTINAKYKVLAIK